MIELFKRLKGSGLKTRILNLDNEWWDFKLGIKTFGHFESGIDDGQLNGPTSYSVLQYLFKKYPLSEKDQIVDLGCGFGRCVCFLAYNFKINNIVGVEANRDFSKRASANSQSLRKKISTLKIVCDFAQNYDFSMSTIVYMYNPFKFKTMQTVANKIASDKTNNDLIIFYLNPIEKKVFDEHQDYLLIDEISHEEVPKLNVGKVKPSHLPAISIYKLNKY